MIFSALGWTISAMGIIQLPIWAVYAVLKAKGQGIDKISNAFKPQPNWGPQNPELFEQYQKYVSTYEEQQRLLPNAGPLVRLRRHIFG